MKEYYMYNEIEDYIKNFDIKKIEIKSKKKIKYYNIPCSFDIEATSCYKDNLTGEFIKANDVAELKEKLKIQNIKFDKERYTPMAWMYIWMLNINDFIIVGRTWKQYMDVMLEIQKLFELGTEKRLMIFIHNYSYEFQYMKSIFEFSKVFSIEAHRPIYAITDFGIEFRCSYLLSNLSLAEVGKNLTKYKAEKKTGDLDYDLIRTSDTILTKEEMGYCINDVVVLNNYIKECMEKEPKKSLLKIPLTSTGYVRRYCREHCITKNNDKEAYTKIIKSMPLTIRAYKKLKLAFQGGFTHANALNACLTFKNVYSMDFTSSYPAVLLTKKFPMGKAVELTKKPTAKQFWYLIYNKACLFTITFKNIHLKENVFESPISKSKCEELECYELDTNDIQTFTEDNGRIVNAELLTTTITDIDFKLYCKCFTWEGFRISYFRYYEYKYLPKELIECVLMFYEMKTTLKDVEGKEALYQSFKAYVNATYGMMVTDIIKSLIEYDGIYDTWYVDDTNDEEEMLKSYNYSKKRFLSYEWGVWCTAHARSNLFTGILEIGDDFIYADTDSLKFTNYEKHKAYFDAYNNSITKDIEAVCEHYNLDINRFFPKTVDGVTKEIGVWDEDGVYDVFKTLGAKRYLVKYKKGTKGYDKWSKTDGYCITVSGLNKKVANPYLFELAKENNCNVEDIFDISLDVDSKHSGKKLHTYIDTEIDEMVTDYQGHITHVKEGSSMHIENSGYSLSVKDYVLNYFDCVQIHYERAI